MGVIDGPETSVRNYHSALRKIQQELISHLHRRESLKSRVLVLILMTPEHCTDITVHRYRAHFMIIRLFL
jgi:hypothetical protein